MTKSKGGGLVPGGAAMFAGLGCLVAAAMLVHGNDVSPVALAFIIATVACFGLGGVQAYRASRKAPHVARRAPSRRQLRKELVTFIAGFILFAPLAGYGGYLLYERDTGPHVGVKITRCEHVGTAVTRTGPHEYCYGDWTYEGRTYINKYVQDADADDEGKVIDCTVHGDAAYSRSLATPLISLIVFGGAASIAAGLAISTWRRWRRAPTPQSAA